MAKRLHHQVFLCLPALMLALTFCASPRTAAAEACLAPLTNCPNQPGPYALCRPNALLDFYTADLPQSGDRASAVTDFSARSVDVSDRNLYVLEGDVRASRADQLLQTDKLSYDHAQQTYTAEGKVRYQDRDLLLGATRATGKADGSAELEAVEYQLLAARGNGSAAKASVEQEKRTQLDAVTYSTCDPEKRFWQLRAKRIELDHENGRGKAHSVTLRIKDVPLFYLPYATFPIDDRRQTGFLYPSVGHSESGGLDVIVPYYLNLAPHYDATLFPRLIAQRGFMFGGEFRYLGERQRGDLEFTYLPDDDEAGRDRGSFRFRHNGVLSPHWSVNADINHVSDDRYFEDFGDSLTAAATSLLPSGAAISGRGSWWNASFGVDSYDLTDPTLPATAEPYRRLPRITLDAERALFGQLQGGLRSELVAFSQDDARLDGERLDLYPYVAWPLEGAAWFLRPEFGVRHTSYRLDRDDDDTPSRTTPITSLDGGLVFERRSEILGAKFLQTLEPRLYYLNVPYRDQDALPLFDTQETSLSFGQLFRSNRFVGADRQMDANNLTVAVTTRLLDAASGEERLSASLGQVRYFDDQRVQLPGLPERDFSGSAYVGDLDLRLSDSWSLGVSEQWDPEASQTQLSAFRVQRRFGGGGVANLSYRYRRDFLEQADASFAYPVSERLRLVGRWNYSLRDDDTLEALAGIEWDSCCYALRILGRHYVRNADGEKNNALYFELELKGLSTLGRRSEAFLSRAILGYR